jgi:hypothetical protein
MAMVPHAGMGPEKSEEPRPWVEELGRLYAVRSLAAGGYTGQHQ